MTVRFELSQLPEHERFGPAVVLRFLGYTSEAKRLLPSYESHLLHPMPGDLLHRLPRLYLQPKVWCYPLNKRRYGPILKDFIATTGQNLFFLDVHFSHL
jgi:hypothetical protein